MGQGRPCGRPLSPESQLHAPVGPVAAGTESVQPSAVAEQLGGLSQNAQLAAQEAPRWHPERVSGDRGEPARSRLIPSRPRHIGGGDTNREGSR